MPSRQIRWITALVAAGLLTAAALAQERKVPEPASGSQAPETKEHEHEHGPHAKPDRKDEPGNADRLPGVPRPGGVGRRTRGDLEQTARDPTPALSAADRTAMRKALLEEAKYRKRLARVKRLRELAERSGDEQRLPKLDDLEAKIKRLYEQRMARFRQHLGDEKFERFNSRVRSGRHRGTGAAKGRPETAGRGGDARGGPKTKQGRKGQGEAGDQPPTGTAPRGKGRPERKDTQRNNRGRGKPKSEDS